MKTDIKNNNSKYNKLYHYSILALKISKITNTKISEIDMIYTGELK